MSRIHAAQWRLTGRTEGLRILRQVQGPQVWHLRYWIQHADGLRDEQTMRTDGRVPLRALTELAQKCIEELTHGTPVVTGGGWDAWAIT